MVQKTSGSEYHIPSSEPFKTQLKNYCLIWRPRLTVSDGLNCLSHFCGIHYWSSLQAVVKHLSIL